MIMIIMLLAISLAMPYSEHHGKIEEGRLQADSRQHHRRYHKHLHKIIQSHRAKENRTNKMQKKHGKESVIVKILLTGRRPVLVQVKMSLWNVLTYILTMNFNHSNKSWRTNIWGFFFCQHTLASKRNKTLGTGASLTPIWGQQPSGGQKIC